MIVFIDNLDDLRERIKGIDYSIMALISQRITLAKQVGRLKQDAGLPVKNFQVEKKVYERILNFAKEFGLDAQMSTSIYEKLIEQSVEVQLSGMSTKGLGGRCLVVGGLGEMGRWICTFLESTGYSVDIADVGGEFPLPERITHKYVFIATPLHTLPKVIEEVCSRAERSTIFEVGSLKSEIEEIIKNINSRGVQLISIHPMFGPGVRHLAGKNILVCTHSGKDEQIMEKVKEIFGSTLAKLVPIALEEHDKLMLYSLDLSHFLNLLNGRILLNSEYNIRKLLDSAGTTFLKQFATTKELHKENPELYYHIQKINNRRSQLFEEIKEAVDSLIANIESENKEDFISAMISAKHFLTEE